MLDALHIPLPAWAVWTAGGVLVAAAALTLLRLLRDGGRP